MDCLPRSLKEFVLKQKCKYHPEILCNLLHLDQEVNNHRVCHLCVNEQSITSKQLISLEDLLNLDSSSKFPLYPLDETLLELLNCNFDIEHISLQVDAYFDELKQKIEKALNRMHDSESLRMHQLINKWKQSKQQLEKLLSIEEIQKILLSQDENYEIKLHNFIENHFSSCSLKIIEQIKQNFSETDFTQIKFNMEQPKEVQNQIFFLIDSINLFQGNDERNFFLPSQYLIKKWSVNDLKLSNSNYFADSKSLQIKSNEKSNKITITSDNANPGSKQCYFIKILNNETNYLIRLKFERKCMYYPSFMFGIILAKDKDYKKMDQSSIMNYSYNDPKKNPYLEKIKQNFEEEKEEEQTIEVRFNISKSYWIVSDYPEYRNAYQLNRSHKMDTQKIYHFAFYMYGPGDFITIEDVSEVNDFDEKIKINMIFPWS